MNEMCGREGQKTSNVKDETKTIRQTNNVFLIIRREDAYSYRARARDVYGSILHMQNSISNAPQKIGWTFLV
jgi:hypothetical protein